MNKALDRAIAIAGGQTGLARLLGLKQGHVWAWRNKRKKLPAGKCPSIEMATGVRCEELRPDVEWIRDASGRVVSYNIPVGITVLPPVRAAQQRQAAR